MTRIYSVAPLELIRLHAIVTTGLIDGSWWYDTLMPRPNGHNLTDDYFKCYFVTNIAEFIHISPNFITKSPIINKAALVQIVAWYRRGDNQWWPPLHYNDVIMASHIISLTIVYSTVYWGAENIKAPRQWPLWGEFTGDRWIPRTKG